MISEYRTGFASWIDLESPTHDEVRGLAELYGVHPRIAEELLSPSPFSGFRFEEDTFLVSLFFPAHRHTHTEEEVQEVDFIIKEGLLVTARYDTVDALHKFKKEFEVANVTQTFALEEDSYSLFSKLSRKLYKSVRHELEFMLSDLKVIEREIFSGTKNREILVEKIADRSRTLLSINHTLSLNRISLERLERTLAYQSKNYEMESVNTILLAHDETLRFAQNTMEALKELREANYLLVTVRQNEAMKILAIISFVTFPLSLVAGIFGMNTKNTPLIGHPNDFWVLVVSMAAVASLFFTYFKHKKWL